MSLPPESGKEMHKFLERLFPICRSLTGDGVRQTLAILKERIPLKVYEVPTGTRVFDWTIPKEWNIRGGYIEDEKGTRIVDFKDNNLHVVGYSTPIDARVPLSELQKHLHSFEDVPDGIPYITSYYKETWGFCMAHNKRTQLKEGMYHVVIDSELKAGSLTYGEYILPGETKEEILISTYICHPSMANNELSGPVVATFLAQTLVQASHRYSYRFVFIPEAIGAITYLSRNLKEMQKRTIAGFNLTCMGDERIYSYMPTPSGTTLADRAARCVLSFAHPEFKTWSFLERGSDERQYCSPLVDLPVVSIMRSKYATYPEYHTSLDNTSFVTPRGLQGSLDIVVKAIELLENNYVYRATIPCEPQLGKRGLYETDARTVNTPRTKAIANVLAYADGTRDVVDISTIIGVAPWDLYEILDRLEEEKLIERAVRAKG